MSNSDRPPKPATYNGDITMLPLALSHLREQKVWLCWRWFWDGKKWTKPPRRADDPDRNAKASDPSTWGTYEQAVEQVLFGNADGIGFALQGRDIGGIDLDHCRDPYTGQIEDWGNEYVQQFPDAYVEATVSGKGLRILGNSHLKDFAPKHKLPEKGNGAAIELFSNSNHYLTLSCNQIGECIELPPIEDGMVAINAALGRKREKNGNGFDFTAEQPAGDAQDEQPKAEEAPPRDEQPATAWSWTEDLRLRAALAAIPTDEKALSAKLGHSHDAWVKIGRAIERLDWGQRGYAIFRDWSAQNQKEFDEKGLRTQWASFARTRDTRAKPITIGTVFHYARQFGWQQQQRTDEQPRTSKQTEEDDEIFDASELDKMQFEPVKSVVPGVFVEGLTLFCGKPKLGKSWLLLHAAHAVASSGFTLGNTHCIEGDVLYCSLEDNKRRLKSRMRKLFGDRPRSPRLQFKIKMPRLAEGGIEVLRNWIKSVSRPRLIAIDTLAMVRMPGRKDQSAYDADYAAVIELRNLAHEFGIAIVVVHHVRKMEADDAFDTVSGTLGLTGCPDSIVILKRDTTGTMLLARGRDLEEVEKAITFNKQACTWTIEGDADEVRQSAQRQQIIAALRDAGEPRTPKQIATDIGVKERNVRKLLGKMVTKGSLQKTAYGKYQLAPKQPEADIEF